MFIQYYTYKAEDFLTDDYFIDSMLKPTPESEIFGKILIDENKVNVDEFISAFMTLKSLHENKPDVSVEQISQLWNRIDESTHKKEFKIKGFSFIGYVAVACSIVGIISLSLFSYLKILQKDTNQQIADFANENIIHTKQPTHQIQLVSGSNTLAIYGVQAKVEYDENGKLKVNQQSVAVNQSTNIVKDVQEFNQLRVPYGKRAFLKLSDGTSLWVNTGTTVTYPTEFVKNKREIYVDGEVFAEVFHDSKRPFIIKTEKLDVQVLGTVFNVSAYKEDKQTDVVLVSGLVNVKPKNGKPTLIKPNQLFAYTDQASTLRNVDVENYTSWHDGNYIFHNEPIENVLLRLSRYYNVTMKLPSSASGITCSGKLELKDDLNQLLNGLSEITSISYAVKDNEYRIKFE
jgi:ferric-dicitrate binding protein FerR (iron transport regulator)